MTIDCVRHLGHVKQFSAIQLIVLLGAGIMTSLKFEHYVNLKLLIKFNGMFSMLTEAYGKDYMSYTCTKI